MGVCCCTAVTSTSERGVDAEIREVEEPCEGKVTAFSSEDVFKDPSTQSTDDDDEEGEELSHDEGSGECDGVRVVFVPSLRSRRLDLQPDAFDPRDWVFNVAEHSRVRGRALPSRIDLRPKDAVPVFNQGSLGSCSAHTLAAAFHFEQRRQGLRAFRQSRLFIRYNERAADGELSEHAGSSLRDGIRALKSYGVCSERLWPYNAAKIAEKPSPKCYDAAKSNKCQQYARVEQNLESLKGCLTAGFPFVFGFQLVGDLLAGDARSPGTMVWPPQGATHGRHAVQACGYDDRRSVFIVRNSWGAEWGDQGYFYMPYECIVHPEHCQDFWAILWVEGEEFPTTRPATGHRERMSLLTPVKTPESQSSAVEVDTAILGGA